MLRAARLHPQWGGEARIERLDSQTVMGSGHELAVERRTLEHALDQLEPILAARRRKIGGEGKDIGVSVGHWP